MALLFNSNMYVVKRSGRQEPVQFDKITKRLSNLTRGLDTKHVFPEVVAQKVVAYIKPGITTSEIDQLAAETSAYMSTRHSDYGILAARILISNLHKQTPKKFSEAMEKLNGGDENYLDPVFIETIRKNKDKYDEMIKKDADYDYDYFGVQTLIKSYLGRLSDGTIVETPQYMLMRVAVALHLDDVKGVCDTYEALSRRHYIHATPTLFHAGKKNGQLSSCFLLQIPEDSLDSIYDTLKQTAIISKHAGGVGLAIHRIRASGAKIASSRGRSDGILPMLRNYNATARYCNQGGRRKGGFAIYLEPWHSDIFSFLQLRYNTGVEEERCRDIFTALWIPDLFMKRVKDNKYWSLFSPDETPDLCDLNGEAFEEKYIEYERAGKARKVISSQKLWIAIIESMQQTGTPYILFKDHCNRKSNQKHLGTIHSSNLCTEIIEYTSKDEVAVCNLASINYASFVRYDEEKKQYYFDFEKLASIASLITRNLDKVIDKSFYPIKEARNSNLRHRPIGIGDMGLADVFQIMGFAYDSQEAKKLNVEIAETVYYACMKASMEMAREYGKYSTFDQSPLSQGIFQFDMWGRKPSGDRYDWESLRKQVMQYGVRNSLLRALMPTASTSQIMGQTESFEPLTSNLYVRRTQAGEFIVINPNLVKELTRCNLWVPQIISQLVKERGSVQKIEEIPQRIKDIYKTVWEISLKVQIDMSADRGAFICQSQSFNVHMENPTVDRLTSMLFYAWSAGLKTGCYYLKTKPAVEAIQFTVDSISKEIIIGSTLEKKECDGSETCLMCQ